MINESLHLENVLVLRSMVNLWSCFTRIKWGGNGKIVKLYSRDSISIDEKYYGEHPMVVAELVDSSITFIACVYDAHGDSIYRKWYLDNSVDKNIKIGRHKITYRNNHNCDEGWGAAFTSIK